MKFEEIRCVDRIRGRQISRNPECRNLEPQKLYVAIQTWVKIFTFPK